MGLCNGTWDCIPTFILFGVVAYWRIAVFVFLTGYGAFLFLKSRDADNFVPFAMVAGGIGFLAWQIIQP